jgi:hypothetical protein
MFYLIRNKYTPLAMNSVTIPAPTTPRGYEYQICIGDKPPKQEIFYNGAKKAMKNNMKYNFYYTINNNKDNDNNTNNNN